MEEVKLNFRGKCENLDCEVCKEVEESQKHILECREITKMKKDIERPPEYKIYLEKCENENESCTTFS